MKNAGYQKHGLVWVNAASADVTHCLELQNSPYGTENSQRFTFNLGACHSTAYELFWGRSSARVRPVECPFDVRIGTLLPGGVCSRTAPGPRTDHWWRLTPAVNSEKLGEEIEEVLTTVGLPFLASISSLESMLEILEQVRTKGRFAPQRYVYIAILKALTGDVQGAEQVLLSPDLRKGPWADWADRVLGRLRERSASQS
jgi:hypothetical protein